jgi:cytochrome c
MKKIVYKAGLSLGLFLFALGNTFAAGDAVRGQELYQKMCIACHSIDYNGIGPAHKGVFNQKAGRKADYTYSPAVKSSNVVWNEKNLDKWLANPEKFIPGQKMGFLVPKAKDRADLIAYLKSDAVK